MRGTLNGLGFVADPGGGHVIFRRPGAGLVVSVPNVEGEVRPIYAVTAARQIADFGIATEAAVEARLEKAARNDHLQTV
nr:type II toxin-antitoxin system HicA family toxin [uncultured Rhodopila sp.]